MTEMETLSFEYFIKVAASKFFLLSARNGFATTVLSDILQMAIVEPGLKDALVALGAVTLYPTKGDALFEHLSLSTYYRTIGRVVRVLDLATRDEGEFDIAAQMTVYLLFVHGVRDQRCFGFENALTIIAHVRSDLSPCPAAPSWCDQSSQPPLHRLKAPRCR